MPAKSLFGGLKAMDAFGKTMEDVKVRTRTGAFLTLVSAAIILSFTIMEFMDYRRIGIDTSVVVDRSRGEKLTVHLNMTFPRVPCYLLSLDLMDISGELQRDISHDVVKTRLTAAGTAVPGAQIGDLHNDIEKMSENHAPDYCGSCYGGEPPENGCCNSCDDVRESYTRKGWSFGNPSGVQQVRIALSLSFISPLVACRILRRGLMLRSAFENTGPNTSRSRRRKAATSPVSCA